MNKHISIFFRNNKSNYNYIFEFLVGLLIVSFFFIIKYNNIEIVKDKLEQKIENRKIIIKNIDYSIVHSIPNIEKIMPQPTSETLSIKSNNKYISNISMLIKQNNEVNLYLGDYPKKENEILVTRELANEINNNEIDLYSKNENINLRISGVINDSGKYLIIRPNCLNEFFSQKIINQNNFEIIVDNYENIDLVINKLQSLNIVAYKSNYIQELEIKNINKILNVFNLIFIIACMMTIMFLLLIVNKIFSIKNNWINLFFYLGYKKSLIYKFMIYDCIYIYGLSTLAMLLVLWTIASIYKIIIPHSYYYFITIFDSIFIGISNIYIYYKIKKIY